MNLVRYHWIPSNLLVHVQKHPQGACQKCWSILFPHQAVIDACFYEAESLRSIQDHWLQFQAWYLKDPNSERSKTKYFVSEQLIMTVAHAESGQIKTCFRFHEQSHLHDLGVEIGNRISLIKKIGRKKHLSLGKIERFSKIKLQQRNYSDSEYRALKAAVASSLRS